MKAINIYVEDEDYEQLEKVKGTKTWRELLLSLIKKDGSSNSSSG